MQRSHRAQARGETAAQGILTTIQTIQGSLNTGNSLTQLQTAANQVYRQLLLP